MAKNGSICHYRQTGDSRTPASLPYGELAVAKDGTVFAGNQHGQPVSRADTADTAATASRAYEADDALRASVAGAAQKLRAEDISKTDGSVLDLTAAADSAAGTFHLAAGGLGSMQLYRYDHADRADRAAAGSFGIGAASLQYTGDTLQLAGAAGLAPAQDNAVALGGPGARFSAVYAATGSISTSDRRAKNSLQRLDAGLCQQFVAELLPVSYKLNEGRSGRRHWGLVAQDVERAMALCGLSGQDFAGSVRTPARPGPDGGQAPASYGLRYQEFIAPLVVCVQQLMRDRDELAARVRLLENQRAEAERPTPPAGQ